MKTDDAGRKHAPGAARRRRADSLFVGLGVVPMVLLLGGQPGIALLLFIPLMLAACLCGMWEQVGSGCGPAAGDGDRGGPMGGASTPTGISLRRKM